MHILKHTSTHTHKCIHAQQACTHIHTRMMLAPLSPVLSSKHGRHYSQNMTNLCLLPFCSPCFFSTPQSFTPITHFCKCPLSPFRPFSLLCMEIRMQGPRQQPRVPTTTLCVYYLQQPYACTCNNRVYPQQP